MELVLSLFPGVDLLGRSFERAGFCVVRGPDLVTGGDVAEFTCPPGRVDGIIGGPPCQGFSSGNRHRHDDSHYTVVNSRRMVQEFCRVVAAAMPTWFLMENVPNVPDVIVAGFHVQRLAISDAECGGCQVRNRHIQFGHLAGWILRPARVTGREKTRGVTAEAITTKPNSRHVTFAEQCRKQGLDGPLSLPGWSREAKFRAVGNGVSMYVGRVLAAAVRVAGPRDSSMDCPCDCGRTLTGKQRAATASCRKRLQLDRERARSFIDLAGYHAPIQIVPMVG